MLSIIEEKKIALGSLVLIIHGEHLTKSGFWRKIKDNKMDSYYYILEKPIHRNYDIDDKSLEHTHKEDGLFVVKANTVAFEQSNGNPLKYRILTSVRGTDAVNLVRNNYDFTTIDIKSPNVEYTSDFIEFLNLYDLKKKNNNVLKEMTDNLTQVEEGVKKFL